MLLITSPTHAAPLPVETYGKLPFIERPQLSPDGTRLAFISSLGGRRCIRVQDLTAPTPPSFICPEHEELRWFAWKTNDRLIEGAYVTVRTQSGRLITVANILGVDRDGGHQLNLVKPRQGGYINFDTDTIVDFLEHDPRGILVRVYTSSATLPDVIRVDIDTGETTTIVPAAHDVVAWMSDPQGRIRIGSTLTDGKVGFQFRGDATGDFSAIPPSDILGRTDFWPLGFADDPDQIYVKSHQETGRTAIYLYDAKRGRVLDRYASHPEVDIDGLLVGHGHVVGYSYILDQPVEVFTDPDWRRDDEALRAALPNDRVLLLDRTEDGSRGLALAATDAQPSRIYAYSRPDGGALRLTLVGSTRPDIPQDQVVPVTPVTYRARDGLQIHAYLTMPAGTKGPIPFVVLPHGGPYARDAKQFDFLAQMIASRGYGVLQPNFRGSTGYGRAFKLSGFQQWGLSMQDDVTDGTRWLIDQKLADPARICIVGWSYGGYAALMGAIREPGLYRCVASMAGVTDLKRHFGLKTRPDEREPDDPGFEGNPSDLDANSPALRAAEITAPVLLAHGRLDVTVPVTDSEHMEAALERAGRSVQSIYFAEDDHFLYREPDRIQFLVRLDQFLAEHLGSPRSS